MNYKVYLVGGPVRDEILGVPYNDIDYTVVVENPESQSAQETFQWLISQIESEGCTVFATKPEVFTIRARFVKDHHTYPGLLADFVLARKESGFTLGTRNPATCVVGTLFDDLERRDFTVNAIAKDPITGELIDPFEGISDIFDEVLRCPVGAEISFNDDPLRVIRALRFSVTKGFSMNANILYGISELNIVRFIETVSIERLRDELEKMFKFDTMKSFAIMEELKDLNFHLYEYIVNTIWFRPNIIKEK